jgi:tetratricopeptide (TPR) repeat protein
LSPVRLLLHVGLLAASGGACNGENAAPPGPSAPAKEAFARAREHFLAEDSVQAAEELRRAVELAPDWAEYRLQLGKLLYTLCSVRFSTATFDRACLEQALAELERACALDPKNAEAAYWAGRALEKVPNVEAARIRFETVLAIDPRHGLALKELGLLAAGEGDAERAKDFLTRAKDLLPKDDEVHFQLGMLLESEDRLEEAKALFQRATELNPAHPGPLTRLAWIHHRQGDEDAATRTEQVLAQCKEFGKRLTQATQRYERNRRDAEACLEVAKLYHQIGMDEAALGWAERALRLGSKDDWAIRFAKRKNAKPADLELEHLNGIAPEPGENVDKEGGE